MIVTSAAVYFLGTRLADDLLQGLFPEAGLAAGPAILVILGGPVVLWTLIACHEVGHALAGLAAGFRVEVMAAGFLLARRDPDSGVFSVGFSTRVQHFFGLTVAVPTDPVNIRKRALAYVAGGPVASLAAGMLALAVFWPVPVDSGWLAATRALGLLFGAGSVLMGLITLVPSRSSYLPSDGARILDLIGCGPASEREAALLWLSALEMQEPAPESWPRELMAVAAGPADNSRSHVVGLLFAYRHQMARGLSAEARDTLVRALAMADLLDPDTRMRLAGEAAFIARSSGASEAARAWEEAATC